jgi:hypothetical protein
MKDRDILLTGDKWTIAVNVALDDYLNLIRGMRFELGQIRRNIQAYKNQRLPTLDIHWEEIGRLDKVTNELEDDLNSFSKLLSEEIPVQHPLSTTKRERRGLINVLGYGLKYLFGTADAKDVKRLNSVCDNLHAFEKQTVHAMEQQLTYLSTLDKSTKQNARDTVELAKVLRDSIQNISLRLHRDEADLQDTQVAIEKQVRYSTAIREIEMAMLEMKFSLIQLQESLDLTSVGKLSSNLINPYNLSNILQQVSLHLPAGTSMLTGLTVEEMYVYYAVATVHAVATSRSIRLFIEIPLKAADRYFELYQVHSLPFFHEEIDNFVTIDEPFSYLAVAEDRQYFTTLTPHMLSKCATDYYTVCPSNVVLKKPGQQNCVIALFFGKMDTVMEKCKRLI